ncbi:M15 family metallopeptidase [Luteococcus sp. OSA5]|uniref:M15 family metallopeptidase n=1 Tax=Luteococcus sp. OSA5 TaxID=3401630 RepID=UPI003B42AA3D
MQCVSGCPSATSFWAGFGSYRITGRATGVPAGTSLSISQQTGTRAHGVVARATVAADGGFTATVRVLHAGNVTFTVAAPDGTRAVSPRLSVGAPAVQMSASSYTASTVKGTRVQGRVTTGMSGRTVRLAVWAWFPKERVSRWSYSAPVTTGADGTFSTVLSHNNGAIISRKWKAESNYASNPKVWFSTTFKEYKAARIDFSTGKVTSAMVPVTYRSGCPVGPSQLTRISMNHFGFDGRIHTGHLIVRSTDVARFRNVFTDAFVAHFPMRIMKDPSPYRNDDNSMAADNTYAFFCRQVNGNPYVMSPHSYGRSVDINPVENPYRKPNGYWYPVNGRPYVDRSNRRPGMLFTDSPMTKSFHANGFKWLSGFDWQHFEVK